jgi:phytoene synthase
MKQSGKTFYFASLWLSKRVREDVAIAYSFCRAVDDLADQHPPDVARNENLTSIFTALSSDTNQQTELQPICSLIKRFPSIKEPLAALVRACQEDDGSTIINSSQDLERYSLGVAGNVGRILLPILGGSVREGETAAINLGIAMQLTNIARDVLTDLKIGRVYLPTQWLDGVDLRFLTVAEAASDPKVIKAVRRLLQFADSFYTSGIAGLCHINSRERYAIHVGAECYRSIGSLVIKDGRLVERAIVPLTGKIKIAASLIVRFLVESSFLVEGHRHGEENRH